MATATTYSNRANRQAQLDNIGRLVKTEAQVEGLGYLIASFNELNKEGLTNVKGIKDELLAKAIDLRNNTTDSRDLYILSKHALNLGENPPNIPLIEVNHKSLLKHNSTTLTIHKSHSDNYGDNLTYEVWLENLAMENANGLVAGEYKVTATDVSEDSLGRVKVRAVSPSGVVSDWSETISINIKSVVYAGFLHNNTTNKSKRINTNTREDMFFLPCTDVRLNENSNDDPVTQFFDRTDMPHSHMKRYAISTNQETHLKEFNLTSRSEVLSSEFANPNTQIMVKIPEYYIIDVSFIYQGEQYYLMLAGLGQFTFDLNAFGYIGYSNLEGRGEDENGIIRAVLATKEFYVGAFTCTNESGTLGSFVTSGGIDRKPQTERKLSQFRQDVEKFGNGTHIATKTKVMNYAQLNAILGLFFTERGYKDNKFWSRRTQCKWSPHVRTNQNNMSWNIRDFSFILPAVWLECGNKTMIQANGDISHRFNYRGIVNLFGNLWTQIDGFINNGGRMFLVKDSGRPYSDVVTDDYYDTGIDIARSSSSSFTFVKELVAGHIVPKVIGNGASFNHGHSGAYVNHINSGIYTLYYGSAFFEHNGQTNACVFYSQYGFPDSAWDNSVRCSFQDIP